MVRFTWRRTGVAFLAFFLTVLTFPHVALAEPPTEPQLLARFRAIESAAPRTLSRLKCQRLPRP